MMRSIFLVFASLALVACGDSGATDMEGEPPTMSHTFEPIMIEPGEEVLDMCQSWTLNNDETLYVSRVRQTNEGAWHHSNWVFVPEELYGGPDGTWPCGERGYSQLTASQAGGVFFAQSTQTLEETQQFAEGAVIAVPPHHKIVGEVHLLNISSSALSTALSFDLETIPEEEVEVMLQPMAFTNEALDIEPQAESRFGMTCNVGDQFERHLGTPADYNIYYVLAHYHEWGNYFRLSFVDDEGDDRTIFELSGTVGEPLGIALDPPINSEGAENIRVECGYANDTDRRLVYGFEDEEMCVFLAYTDARIKMGGLSGINTAMGPDDDGVFMNETRCGAVVGSLAN